MTELLPCPLCNGVAELRERILFVYSEDLYEMDAYVKCTLCGANSKSFRNDKEKAIKLWNTRPVVKESE